MILWDVEGLGWLVVVEDDGLMTTTFADALDLELEEEGLEEGSFDLVLGFLLCNLTLFSSTARSSRFLAIVKASSKVQNVWTHRVDEICLAHTCEKSSMSSG